jgi:predicted HicB family RNase H-like nuclease
MEKQLETYRQACVAFEKSADWAMFFREVLGVGGIVHQMFPTAEERLEFEKTPEYAEIRAMLVKLRQKTVNRTPESEPTRVITVRLPKSVQEALTEEANQRSTTVNQLCISKLVEWIDRDRVIKTKNLGKTKKRHDEESVSEEAETLAEAG